MSSYLKAMLIGFGFALFLASVDIYVVAFLCVLWLPFFLFMIYRSFRTNYYSGCLLLFGFTLTMATAFLAPLKEMDLYRARFSSKKLNLLQIVQEMNAQGYHIHIPKQQIQLENHEVTLASTNTSLSSLSHAIANQTTFRLIAPSCPVGEPTTILFGLGYPTCFNCYGGLYLWLYLPNSHQNGQLRSDSGRMP